MFSFEQLDVYKKAFALNQGVYRFLKNNASIPVYVKNQFGRASLSVMLNIAEGHAKFSKRDRRNFYTTARASIFECVSLAGFLSEENEIPVEYRTLLLKEYDDLSRMLFALIKKLE